MNGKSHEKEVFDMVQKVGFIGLGDMGLPMAKRVLTCGFEVTVCGHRRRESVETMKSLGAKAVKTSKEIAQVSEVTIVVLPDDNITGEVVLGYNGVMEGAVDGSAIILMGTLSPDFCRKVEKVAKTKDVDVLDAPVTGASIRAETGELGIMVGGDEAVVEKYRSVLEPMGKILYCGTLGSGQTVKLANNMVFQINIHAAFEAISWGIKNGADENLLVELMKMGTAGSWVVQNWEFIKSMNTDPPSPHHWLGAKDLDYALRIGHEFKQPCPLTAMVRERATAGGLKLPEK